MRPRLHPVPCTVQDARAVVARLHRHHEPPLAGLFALAVADDAGSVRGVAIVGRPVSRYLDDGWTVEVTRVATDGCDNACSALYAPAWTVARTLGYTAALTYTLAAESGASLRGAGWVLDEADTYGGGEWSCASRPRRAADAPGVKRRWWAPGSCLPARRGHPTRGLGYEDEAQAPLFAVAR